MTHCSFLFLSVLDPASQKNESNVEELSLNETDRARLEALRLELENEEITLKGFLKKKGEIFAPYRLTSDTSGKGEFGIS